MVKYLWNIAEIRKAVTPPLSIAPICLHNNNNKDRDVSSTSQHNEIPIFHYKNEMTFYFFISMI